jgi:hypothetical protein
MSPTELKMQHTIHLDGKVGHLPRPYPALPSKCIVDCIYLYISKQKYIFLSDSTQFYIVGHSRKITSPTN